MFDYIEMFYNPTRKHTNNGMLSPVDYEVKQKKMNEAGLDLSRFSAAPSARSSHLVFESDGAFPAQC